MIQKILHYFNLEAEIDDFDRIHESILKDVSFKGTNLWILIFAIIIASVGLNMNSTAVIIGAMLISPLMGPINGMGYSIAIYDFNLFKRAVKNFSFAVVTSLITSTTYFILSPISTAHSELLARTSPSIYDVLIALFGGLAGIVATSSTQKGNVIPGVAIATALMPPLCTAGYGIATGQLSFFLGAIYLFTINTVFIALSSIYISQILKFPIRSDISVQEKRKINSYITTVMLLVLIPSIYFGYILVQKERFTFNSRKFITNVSNFEGLYLLKSHIDPDKKLIQLEYGGSKISEEQKKRIIGKTQDFELDSSNVKIQMGLWLDNEDQSSLALVQENNDLKIENQNLKRELEIEQEKNQEYYKIRYELQSLYPEIINLLMFGNNTLDSSDYSKTDTSVALIEYKGTELSNDKRKKIVNWLKLRLDDKDLKVYFERIIDE